MREVPSGCRGGETEAQPYRGWSTFLRVTEATAGVSAYILVQTEIGKASTVRLAIQEIDDVTAEVVSGPYDVIVRATAPSVDDLSKHVVARVQGIAGITRTLLCVVVNI